MKNIIKKPIVNTISNSIIIVKPVLNIDKSTEIIKMIENPENFIKKNKNSQLKPKKIPWYMKSFKEFCNATSLHGYNYIVRENLPKWERIAWSLIVITALIISVALLSVSWKWNMRNPTVTVIENTHFATWNIPFPAVTFCNINKISNLAAHQLANHMKRPDNLTADDLVKMFHMLVHFEGVGQSNKSDYEQFDKILKMNNLTVIQTLAELSPKCSNMLLRCMWKGSQTRCDNIFTEVNTTSGVCCSFNNYAVIKSSRAKRRTSNFQKHPRKVTACGYQTGLTVLLKPFVNDYHTTFLSSTGFQIFIHNSLDYADDNAETKFINSRVEAFVTITPQRTYSTDALESLSIKDRQCLINSDKDLRVMENYTYNNCMTECRSHYLFKLCGCIPYNYPNNGSIPSCQMDKMICIQKYKELYSSALPGTIYRSASLKDVDCDCLPDCEYLEYFSELTAGRLNRDFAFNSLSFFKDIELDDETIIHIYFNDLVSTLFRRDILLSWMGLLGSFGGLLGLLLGFSFVTGYEMIYFFTIRPFFDYHMAKTKKPN